MPIVTLANNKAVNISLEIFLMDDVKYEMYIQELLASDAGEGIENFISPSSDKIDLEFFDDDILFIRDDV